MSITLSNPGNLGEDVSSTCKNTVTNIKLNQKWPVTLKITIVNKNGQAACPSFQLTFNTTEFLKSKTSVSILGNTHHR